MIEATAIHQKPLFIAINGGSGADANDVPAKIEKQLREAGHTVTLFEIPKGPSIKESCTKLVKQAVQADGIMIAAGGDGTVNSIAALCYEQNATLGIIPLGTFNYFARDLGIPVDLDGALEVFRTGLVRHVSAGFVQEHLFLNNASFGLYPRLIRKREQASSRYGRKRIVAAISALHSLFSEQRMFGVRFHSSDTTDTHRTSMVFVGNNSLQLDNLGLEVSECTQQGRLAVVILKRLNRLQTCRLIWSGIVRNLKFESKLIQFCDDEFVVETRKSRIDVAIDGEIVQCKAPLQFRVEAQAISVVVPPPAEAK